MKKLIKFLFRIFRRKGKYVNDIEEVKASKKAHVPGGGVKTKP